MQDKIAKDEYTDFTIILPKSTLDAPVTQSQPLMLQLNQTGDNFSIHLPEK